MISLQNYDIGIRYEKKINRMRETFNETDARRKFSFYFQMVF